MAFQFQAYDPTPSGRTIGDLILRSGDIRAAQARDIAALVAQQQMASAQSRSQLLTGVGQSLRDILQYRAEAPQRAEQARRQQQRDALTMLQLQKGASDLETANQQRDETQRKATLEQQQRDREARVLPQLQQLFGTQGLGVANPGDDGPSLEQLGATASEITSATGGANAATRPPMTAQQRADEAYRIDPILGPREFDKWQKEHPDPKLVPIQTIGADGKPVTRFVPEEAGAAYALPPKTPPPTTFGQPLTMLVDGVPTPVRAGSDNKYYGPDSQVIEGTRIKPVPPRPRVGENGQSIPGDWNVEGDDFLKSIPPQWRKTVEKIAHYDEDPTKVASMRGGNREMLMQWVNQINPAYDSSQFTNRAPTRKAFTTGTQGQQINALNTAIGHLDQFAGLAEALGTGGFVPGNKAFNAVQTMFGADKVTNFETLKDALAGELASVLSKGAGTVSGIADAKANIAPASSPQQLVGYVKTQIPILGSKLSSLDYQYHQAMGDGDSFSALSPQSKSILTKFGFDPSHPTVGGDGAGGGISITAPNGKTYTFQSQADADAFKQKASIR